MTETVSSNLVVTATVHDVLPRLGLAYLRDAGGAIWTVTRSTPGTGFDAIRIGQSLRLRVVDHGEFLLVGQYA